MYSRRAEDSLRGAYLLSSDGPITAHGSLHRSRNHLAPLRIVGLEATAAGNKSIVS